LFPRSRFLPSLPFPLPLPMGRGMSMFLVRESCDVQRDGVTGAIATREKTLATNRTADHDGAQRVGHVAERQRMKLAFHPPLSARFMLLRTMRERAFERRNSDRRIAKFSTLRESRGEPQPIIVGVRQDLSPLRRALRR